MNDFLDAEKTVQQELGLLTNEQLSDTLARLKSEEPYHIHEWPEWLYNMLQEWFEERGE